MKRPTKKNNQPVKVSWRKRLLDKWTTVKGWLTFQGVQHLMKKGKKGYAKLFKKCLNEKKKAPVKKTTATKKTRASVKK